MSFSILAREISQHCETLDRFIADTPKWNPRLGPGDGSSDAGSKKAASPDVRLAMESLLSMTSTLQSMVAAPSVEVTPGADMVFSALTTPYYLMALRTLQKYRIPNLVPRGDGASISVADLVCRINNRQLGVRFNEEFLGRIIKFASSFSIFVIDESTMEVQHTQASLRLRTNSDLSDSLAVTTDSRFISTADLVLTAFEKRWSVAEPSQAAFKMAFDTDLDFLAFMRHDSDGLLNPMHGFLEFVMKGSNMGGRNHRWDMWDDDDVIDWSSLQGLVVDMGGGHGQLSLEMSAKYPNLSFIVQDLPEVIQNAVMANTPPPPNIRFRAHNFFNRQRVRASIYMFRFVMHDWADENVIRILRQVKPAMADDSRIVILDYLLRPPTPEPGIADKLERTMDLAALALLCGKERSRADWTRLIEEVNRQEDEEVIDMDQPSNRTLVVEFHQRDDDALGLVILGFSVEL